MYQLLSVYQSSTDSITDNMNFLFYMLVLVGIIFTWDSVFESKKSYNKTNKK